MSISQRLISQEWIEERLIKERLDVAASSGDINSLYSIIKDDPYVLDRIDQVPFVDSPLHISASTGHVHFCLEMIRLKPSLAKKLNPEGDSPIHLALKNDQTEIVFRLADVDQDLVSLQGKEGLTPLHIAATLRGKDKLLAKLLVSYPKSIKELTVRKESALHIAVKADNIEALKILLKWTKQASMNSILNWSDDKGNNIMHLAAAEGNNIRNNLVALGNKIKMVKLLLNYKVDIKSKNLEGMTAVDILRRSEFLRDRELREKLGGNHILKPFKLPKLSTIVKAALLGLDKRAILHTSNEDRNAILVVSVLIATATYQAILSPPDKDEIAPLKGQFQAINLRLHAYELFKACNTMAFVASMLEICLHLPSNVSYILQLVVPLVICYMLLISFQWPSFNLAHTAGSYIFFLVLSKIPNFGQKLRESILSELVLSESSVLAGREN